MPQWHSPEMVLSVLREAGVHLLFGNPHQSWAVRRQQCVALDETNTGEAQAGRAHALCDTVWLLSNVSPHAVQHRLAGG